MSQKRKYNRTENPFALKMRPKHEEDPDSWHRVIHDWNLVVAKNMSADGVLFYYAFEDLEIDSLVDFKIYFSKSSPPIECVGKIIRTKEHPTSPLYELAISFIEMDEQKREMINKIINENL